MIARANLTKGLAVFSAIMAPLPMAAFGASGQTIESEIAQGGEESEVLGEGTMRKAFKPEEIADLFIAYANAGDVDGVLSLFEDNAVVAGVGDHPSTYGKEAIRANFTRLLADNPKFEGVVQRPAVVNGDIALTSAWLPNGIVTTEVARRQADGSWLWIIDQPVAAVVPAE